MPRNDFILRYMSSLASDNLREFVCTPNIPVNENVRGQRAFMHTLELDDVGVANMSISDEQIIPEPIDELWFDSQIERPTPFRYIHDYNYIPTYLMHKVNNEEELFLGAEIEIDKYGENEDVAKYVIETMGENNVFCKHDGSLSNGFEIVTHPCTLEYHRALPYDRVFDELIRLGYRSHNTKTCGLHVHFNRNYLGKDKIHQDLGISILLYLFEKFWDKIVLISRRDSNRYARRFEIQEDESAIDLYAKSKNADKYTIINLNHKDTIEIRIFRGTLNYGTYLSTLEFVNTLVKLIKEINIYDLQEVSWEKIYDRFSDNLKNYIKERESRQIDPEINKNKRKELNDRLYELSREYSSFRSNNPRRNIIEDEYTNTQNMLNNLVDVAEEDILY